MKPLKTSRVTSVPTDGIIFDPSSRPVNIVNVTAVLNHINSVLLFMKEPDNKLYNDLKIISKTKDTDKKKQLEKIYEKTMEKKFPLFNETYPSTFQKVIYLKDISTTLFMLSKLSKVKKGNLSFNDAEKDVGNMLRDKFVKNKKK
jgi:hypothetical protein